MARGRRPTPRCERLRGGGASRGARKWPEVADLPHVVSATLLAIPLGPPGRACWRRDEGHVRLPSSPQAELALDRPHDAWVWCRDRESWHRKSSHRKVSRQKGCSTVRRDRARRRRPAGSPTMTRLSARRTLTKSRRSHGVSSRERSPRARGGAAVSARLLTKTPPSRALVARALAARALEDSRPRLFAPCTTRHSGAPRPSHQQGSSTLGFRGATRSSTFDPPPRRTDPPPEHRRPLSSAARPAP